MAGVSCDQCGAKLKVKITGGNFYVRDGSTLDNLNFEKDEDSKIITLGEPTKKKMDEDTTLSITIRCSANADHLMFGTTDSTIKKELYRRIIQAAQKFIRKYA